MTTELGELFERNRRWAESIERRTPGFFTRLLEQQAPQYLWMGCADSRVPANELIGLLPGEVFVHRNIANVVVHADLNCLSVIQFAVDVLKVRHIIVVGHSRCGGVTAALEGRARRPGRQLAASRPGRARPAPGWLDSRAEADARIDALCELNVIEQVRNVCQTTVVRDAWARGQALTVHGWFYGLQRRPARRPAHDRVERRGGGRCRCRRHRRRARPLPHERAWSAATPQPEPTVAGGLHGVGRAAFPAALTDPAPSPSPRRCSKASTATTACFARPAPRRKQRFERGDWHGAAARAGERIESYDAAGRRGRERLRDEYDADDMPMDVWQQVKLHYIGLLIDHRQPECAETFFNSVMPQDPAPQLLQQRLHLRAAGDLAPSTSRTTSPPRSRPIAPTTRRKDARRHARAHRHRTSSWSAPFEDLERDVERVMQAIGEQLGEFAAARQFPDPGAVVAVLPQQGRVHRRADHQRLHETAVRAAGPARRRGHARARHRAVRRRRTAAHVQLRARVLHGRHGSAVGVRAVPALAHAGETEGRDLHAVGLQKQGKNLFYRDLLHAPPAFDATRSSSRPASRAW